jgi:phage shock protein PspC (stress-responsive transcriptional regulator)
MNGMNSNTEDVQYPSMPEAASAPDSQSKPPLRRPHKGRMIAGVAAAISRHFNVDVTIVRVTFAVLAIISFTGLAYLGSLPLFLGGIPLYLACWVLIPEEGAEQSIAATFIRSIQSRSPSS